jgi:hypothetical protein
MHRLPESVVLNNKNHKILSPEGLVSFLGINKISKDFYIHLKFSNGNELKCSTDHPISTINGIIKAKDLDKKVEIHTKDGVGCFVISKRNIKKKIELYDIVNSGSQHLYYSNDLVSHNCEFIGSSATLIPASKLRTLAFKNPKRSFDDIDVYREPEENHIYVITVDCAEGVGQDFSAFSVFDVTELPYRQVAKYKNNTISPLLYPTMIYNAARKYNNSYVLVETNNIGQQVVDILHYDLEYENIFTLEHHSIKGQHISAGFKKSVSFGLKTTKSVKKIGCANLKTLIENDKLLIEDFDTISELNTFVRIKDSYEAEEGNNDDVVMTLVFFSWLTAQSYFKQITDSDVRKTLSDDHNLMLEEDMSPVGFFDENIYRQETFREGDDMWSIVEDRGYKTSTL